MSYMIYWQGKLVEAVKQSHSLDEMRKRGQIYYVAAYKPIPVRSLPSLNHMIWDVQQNVSGTTGHGAAEYQTRVEK